MAHQSTHQKNHTKKKSVKPFVTAEEGETYAVIKTNKGGARFDVEVVRTGKLIIAKARGSLIKGPGKQRLQIGDTILIQEGAISYILTKYTDDEIKKLTKMGELVSFKPKSAGDASITFEDEMAVLDKEVENMDFDINDI